MYSYTTFGAVTLPAYNRTAGMAPAAAAVRVIPTLAGAYDLDGSAQAALRWPHPLSVEAVVWESSAASLKTALDALRALTGTRAYLTRRADSDASTQRALCRLASIEMSRSHEQRGAWQPVVLNFLQLAPWEAPTASTLTDSILITGETKVLANAGNLTCNNCVVTLTPLGAYVTSMAITGTGIDWALTSDEPFAVDQPYVVDCAAESVLLNGTTDAYARFALGSGHTRETWLPLAPGNNSITVTPTGEIISVTFSWRSTWA